ncbi:MAG: RagB/SusD family nutrient uptake outer membrane protein, partial [Bacteroidia bacterium]|nr:RagB/SusD family nutrient uptake outer membrane protein [Bacteroidia bacterium]
IYLVIISCMAFLASCSDYLDREPQTAWSDSNFFTQESHIIGTLNGGYDLLQAALGSNFVMYGDMRADIYKLNDPTRLTDEKALNNSLDINLSAASWRSFYNVIKQANLVIYYTPKLVESKKITATNGNNYIGQAYCMRAFAYFWIVRIWGDAPIVLTPYSGGERIQEVRKPQTEVLDTIQADLADAISLIPLANIDRFTFTRTAAYAIQAQVYAWQHNWPAVITSANKILNSTTTTPIVNANYSLVQLYDSVSAKSLTGDYLTNIMLNTGYSKMFNVGLSTESIFELPFSIDDNENNNSLFGLLADSYAEIKPRIEFIDQYAIKDWRQFINFWGGEKAMKFFNGTFTKNINIRNVILLRLAETVLLKAEALVYLNDTEMDSVKQVANIKSAMTLVNLIRTRAGGTDLIIPETTYSTLGLEQIKDIVLQERNLELAFEGYRYFDLIRTGNVANVMEPINGQTNPLSFVWPIHLDEIRNSNGLIVQNEYYK